MHKAWPRGVNDSFTTPGVSPSTYSFPLKALLKVFLRMQHRETLFWIYCTVADDCEIDVQSYIP